jgi:hypothetical protein
MDVCGREHFEVTILNNQLWVSNTIEIKKKSTSGVGIHIEVLSKQHCQAKGSHRHGS